MTKHTRVWEVDFLRGIAVILMVGYHFVFDLALVGVTPLYPIGGLWRFYVWFVASLFLMIVGFSMWLARKKSEKSLIQHGFTILGWGMFISLVTYLFDPSTFVRFGILHLIGLAVILTAPLVKHRKRTLAILTGIWFVWIVIWLTTGFQIECGQCSPVPYPVEWLLMILGFWPSNWQTFDYYPLLPWWGVVVMGLFLGQKIYPAEPRSLIKMPKTFFVQKINLIGEHALKIYLAHQPLLLLFVWILAKVLEN